MKLNSTDCCSLSNIGYFKILHLDWFIDVDFPAEILRCTALQKYECIKDGASKLILDTERLYIETISIDDVDVECKLMKTVGQLGEPLEIYLPSEKCKVGCVFNLSVKYHTSPSASATQWLLPPQTLGKRQPYMYTQCEAIHARSLLPCQDSPCHKFTYTAEIIVPEGMVALMGAIKGDEDRIKNGKRKHPFEQTVPIPSYLLAIAIGELEFRSIGPRSKVWCEKEMIDSCQFEFAEVGDMLSAAESLMGPYLWGDYDLLILPPSFPMGGMENPCLTFATPTIITGDRSLTNVVVHEITHSWTGNLVTNLTWEHFWLNEGFTRFIEDKIIGILEGEEMRQFMGINGWNALLDDVEVFGATNKLTALTPNLEGVVPDDAFSSVPYEKGSSFLYYIESLVGGADIFNPFLRSYIDHFKFKSIVTDDFKKYLLRYFKDKKDVLNQIDWDAWLHSPGMPPVNVIDMYDKTLSNGCKSLCKKWITTSQDELESFQENDFSSFTTMQKIDFLSKLYHEKPLPLIYIQKMDEIYKMSSYKNVSEIEFAFLRLCIRAKWVDMYANTVEFITKQGRMKYVRPLYREMFKYEQSKQLAIDTFEKNRHVYHILASRMIAKDLHLNE